MDGATEDDAEDEEDEEEEGVEVLEIFLKYLFVFNLPIFGGVESTCINDLTIESIKYLRLTLLSNGTLDSFPVVPSERVAVAFSVSASASISSLCKISFLWTVLICLSAKSLLTKQ